MTIEELYEWACSHGVTKCPLVVRNFNGDQTYGITPEIIYHDDPDSIRYVEVELEGDARWIKKKQNK